ncbi:probable cytochrome P450 6d5 [Bradysia coprophila]|uniref:probable cytochrome P450 6d5 n=1 Tax=Bradysia coprophila TaxID=38358 RepID=UPI00187D8192|nr:probable cytochrome P450 6d5 [Bradysia coprophila]
MSALLIPLSLLVTLLVTAYLYVKHSYSYWKRRGVPYLTPSFLFGTFANSFQQKTSFGQDLADMYNQTTEPFIGIYTSVRAGLLVRDPKIIKDILVKDFQSFGHRGFNTNVDVDPMSDNVLLQQGDRWKRVRTQLSPAFSSGKLKGMFETILSSGKSLDEFVGRYLNTNKSLEMREVFARFATNVIVSVAFGIDIDCIKNPDCEFRKNGQKVFEPNMKNMLRANVAIMLPKLHKLLGLRFADKDVGDFMIDAVRQNFEYRETNSVIRKDFFQMLMQLRNTGKIRDDDDDWSAKSSASEKAITLEETAAHAFLFFAGGFESSSSTMSFCMYELAKHPDIQQRAYSDIVDALRAHGGQMTYESVAEMKYIDHCIDESLRLHPPFPMTARQCTKEYRIPDTNVVIEKGTTMFFSTLGLHYDRKYYDEPEKFMPERYAESNGAKSFLEMPNLTFGDGPRNCLGLRLGKLQSKIAIVLLLHKFKFELDDMHKGNELKISPISVVLAPTNGINLKVLSR